MDKIIQHDIDLSKHLIKDGPDFCTHRALSNDRVFVLKPTFAAIAFSLNYVVVGLLLVIVGAVIYWQKQQFDLSVFVGGFGIAIATYGVTILWPYLKNTRFDKDKGSFVGSNDREVLLENILQLQINAKEVKGKSGINYPCYELNMFTEKGRRINILNHNNLEQMRKDAQLLSDFLAIEYVDFV